jgi:SAM-dependent methyltransferase
VPKDEVRKMNWKIKAILMDTFSYAPLGEELHYWTQKNVSKSLPTSDQKFLKVIDQAKQHEQAYQRYAGGDFANASLYEFGAGWDLAIPLCYYCLGVERQTLVDIRPLLKIELVNASIEKLRRMATALGLRRVPGEQFSATNHGNWRNLLRERYGINYLAPCDARATGLKNGSFDFITSTDTLEHIPAEDISLILKECHRVLKPDGRLSFIIDYQDHYSYFDRSIGLYNFLRYSPRSWGVYNPPLHFQNRLRHLDYRNIFLGCGFVPQQEELLGPTPQDIEALGQLKIHASFAGRYSAEELGVRRSHVVLRKQDPQK